MCGKMCLLEMINCSHVLSRPSLIVLVIQSLHDGLLIEKKKNHCMMGLLWIDCGKIWSSASFAALLFLIQIATSFINMYSG